MPGPPSRAVAADKLTTIWDNSLRAVNENKVSAKNCFQMQLIENMTEILNRFHIESGVDDVNFHRAARALDASARIYGCRVDNVYSHADKIRGGLLASLDDDGGKKRRTVDYDEAHLLPPSAITTSWEPGDIGYGDPFFSEVTKKIENGGDQALMLHLFPTGPCGRVVFDGAAKLSPEDQRAVFSARPLGKLRAQITRAVGSFQAVEKVLPAIVEPEPETESDVEEIVEATPDADPVAAAAEVGEAPALEPPADEDADAPGDAPAAVAAVADDAAKMLEDEFQFFPEDEPKKKKKPKPKAKAKAKAKAGKRLGDKGFETPPPKRTKELDTPEKVSEVQLDAVQLESPAKLQLDALLEEEPESDGLEVEAPAIEPEPQLLVIDSLARRVQQARTISLRMPACVETMRKSAAQGTTTFTDLIGGVKQILPADDRESFTTGIAFVCALHMATQSGNVELIRAGDDLGDFEVVPEELVPKPREPSPKRRKAKA